MNNEFFMDMKGGTKPVFVFQMVGDNDEEAFGELHCQLLSVLMPVAISIFPTATLPALFAAAPKG